MPRPSRSAVGFCVAVIALAALIPGICSLEYALFEPRWVLLPDDAPALVSEAVSLRQEQPIPLLGLLPSRAPPSAASA